MIELMFKNVLSNTIKIDGLAKYVSKMDKKYCLMFALLAFEGFTMAKAIRINKKRIIKLEDELEEMKSKGE